MQKNIRILLVLFLSINSLFGHRVLAYKRDDLLARADQLFQQKKYNEAYEIYLDLFTKEGQYTPQTLLKMGFIKEAWGDYAEALFFFNTFYEHFPEKKIFNKMKDIADKQKLSGYEYSDLEFFSTLYKNYHFQIHIAVFGCVLLYFLALFTNMFFIRGLSNSSPFFFIILLVLAAYFINQADSFFKRPKVVVLKDKSLLMSGPSAGATPIQTLKKGNRIVVLNQTDIWFEIQYNDQKAYIRKANVQLL